VYSFVGFLSFAFVIFGGGGGGGVGALIATNK
jgi:hypothetical protein